MDGHGISVRVMTRRLSLILLMFLMLSVIPIGVTGQYRVGSSVDTTPAQTFQSATVLVDESHTANASEMWTPGNASLFGWLLAKNGYNVSTNWNASLDSGILDSYDVLCLFFPMIPLTASELTTIQTFVTNGGGLLMVGVDYSPQSWKYTAANLNPLSQSYGITFNNDLLLGLAKRSAGDIADHQLTYSVESLYSKNDDLKGCSLTVTSPATSLVTIKDKDFVAYAESGSGRVVAVGSAGPFTQLRSRLTTLVDSEDHLQFSLNVIDWLTGNSQRQVDASGKAVFRIRPGPDLNTTELAEYKAFNGIIHDHTTYSDGQNTAFEMVTKAVEVAADFFVITDHSYNNPAKNGIYGGLAGHDIQTTYGLDLEVIPGAELSSIPHTIGFPLHEQIYTSDTQVAVDGIHAQGAIAIFAHPTIASSYARIWEHFEDYGYDAFEVDNYGFFHGLGEQAYFWPFDCASDTHNAKYLGLMRNVVFVKNPSGPNGQVTALDIADAIRHRRNVVVELMNQIVFGDKVWVDRYLDLWDQAESAITTVQSEINALESAGASVTLSKVYLKAAQNAMTWWNPSRALELAQNAQSELLKGFDITILNQNLGLMEPTSAQTIRLNVTNTLNYGVSVNLTTYVGTSLTFAHPSYIVQAAPHTTKIMEIPVTTTEFGYSKVIFNLHDFNTTYHPKPVWLHISGLVRAVNITDELRNDGHRVTIKLLWNPTDYLYVSSVTIQYNLGDGVHEEPMVNYGDGWGYRFNKLAPGTNITYTITLNDKYGHTYSISGRYAVGGSSVQPSIDPMIIAGIGIAGVVVVVVVVFLLKRRS